MVGGRLCCVLGCTQGPLTVIGVRGVKRLGDDLRLEDVDFHILKGGGVLLEESFWRGEESSSSRTPPDLPPPEGLLAEEDPQEESLRQ